MKIKQICILGGTGFVGHHLTSRLAGAGVNCRLISRHAFRHADLRVLPGVEITEADIFNRRALVEVFADCEAVVNLVGILNESAGQGFRRVHVELVDLIADAGRQAGIARFLHMSALNADAANGNSAYLRTKGEAENRAHTGGQTTMQVTSFRPSVIFGPGDSFFNRFATLLRMSPGVFPLACPETRFAPVYVGDVAAAFVRALEDKSTCGKHYDLCGPRIFTLRELVRYTSRTLGHSTLIVGLNDSLSRIQAHVLGHVPGRPFSFDNYLSLQIDSTCKRNGFAELGITPADIDTLVPLYLGQSAQRQRYNQLRRIAQAR